MMIIVDKKISQAAKERLSLYGELLELKTEEITYPAISGHPDIFICQSADKLIIAPNLPEEYLIKLKESGANIIIGEFPVGKEYPATSRYNAAATASYLIHNFRHTDFMITRYLDDLRPVQVDQGYCRCNLLPLKDDHFITSDSGIFKVLQGLHPVLQGLHPVPEGLHPVPEGLHPVPEGLHPVPEGLHPNSIYVSPTGILLEGFPHGFFGGCCGVWEDKIFVNGSLDHYKDGEKVRKYLNSLDYEIIELYNGPLVDCGSILFVIK